MHKKYVLLLYIGVFAAVIGAALGCSAPKLTDALAADQEHINRIKGLGLLEHRVVLAPIESEISRQPIADEKTERLLEIDTATLAISLTKSFKVHNVFRDIQGVSFAKASQGAMIQEARKKNATLLMKVALKKARVYCLGNNDSSFGNTAMWFMLGIPALWGADVNYGVEITATVSFLDVKSSDEFATLIHSYDCIFKEEGGVSYLERSGSLAVLALPPQYCSDDLGKVQDSILPLALEQFILKLAEQTKKELGNK
jgi:hypothetical protein